MRAAGFTLVELMIVVAIIGILAVVAGRSYSRFSHKARAAEAYSLMGEFRAKEEAYRAEFSTYCNSGTTPGTTCPATANAETGAYYPALLAAGEPKQKTTMPANNRPQGWTALGINPGRDGLYCGYDAIAGTGSAGMGTMGTAWFSSAVPTGPYWYVLATCDLDGNSAVNSIWITGSNSNAISLQNEGF